MEVKDFLQEELKTFGLKKHMIFVNPSIDEIIDAAKGSEKYGRNYVRFIVDIRDRKFYAFPADLLHSNAARAINAIDKKEVIPPSGFFVNGYIFGEGNYDKQRKRVIIDKARITNADEKKNLSWIEKYATLEEYLDSDVHKGDIAKKENTMNDFKEYLSEREEQEIEKQLNEDPFSVIGSILGFGIGGLAVAFGASLLARGGVGAVKKIVGMWRKTIKSAKSIRNPNGIIRIIKTDPKVNKVAKEVEEKSRKYDDVLKDVYIAIGDKNFALAKEEFMKLPAATKNNPDVQKAIITDITRVLKSPPLYIQSPGNTCYQKIKQILNIRIARAAAKASELAFEDMIEEKN